MLAGVKECSVAARLCDIHVAAKGHLFWFLVKNHRDNLHHVFVDGRHQWGVTSAVQKGDVRPSFQHPHGTVGITRCDAVEYSEFFFGCQLIKSNRENNC